MQKVVHYLAHCALIDALVALFPFVNPLLCHPVNFTTYLLFMTTSQTLKVWMQGWPAALQVNLLPELSDQLATTIDIDTQGWDWKRFYTKLLRSIEDGSAPDVIEIGTTWTSRLIQEGVLLDITDFAIEHLYAARTFFPRVLNSCRHVTRFNEYYAAPMLADVRILFYNDDILNVYLAHHPNAFKSWQAFEAMCFSLKNVLPNHVIAWPLGRVDAFHDCLPWVWAAGGDFISLSGQLLVDSEQTQKAFRRLACLILTECAPLPPGDMVNTIDQIRLLFSTGQIGIMTGALWMLQNLGQFTKAALHPPDVFPATFVGGSNLAIVRKYGANEHDDRYQLAKAFIAQMVETNNQMILAEKIGKLPCNILAWEEMKRQNRTRNTRPILQTFDDALCYTVERGMPNVPNLVQIEEELKTTVKTIWERVGTIKREHSLDGFSEIETSCATMIQQELTQAKERIRKFLTGDTVQLTQQEVQEIGITPPGRFDLWIEVTSENPADGHVYVAGRGQIMKGIGQQAFAILLALVNAPNRTLSEDQLLSDFWGYTARVRAQDIRQIKPLAKEISQLMELLKNSIDVAPKEVMAIGRSLIKTFGNKNTDAGRSNIQPEQLQREILQLMQARCEEIDHITNEFKFAHVRDNLRHACDGINHAISPIGGETVVLRIEQGLVHWTLNSNLSVCIVTS
ncbi:MAG: extracellular solute-binding protein [Caldilineaceae bacterium]